MYVFLCSFTSLTSAYLVILRVSLICISSLNFSWWEGVITEKSKEDETMLTVRFPGMNIESYCIIYTFTHYLPITVVLNFIIQNLFFER